MALQHMFKLRFKLLSELRDTLRDTQTADPVSVSNCINKGTRVPAITAIATGPRVTDLQRAYWQVTRRDKSPGDQKPSDHLMTMNP